MRLMSGVWVVWLYTVAATVHPITGFFQPGKSHSGVSYRGSCGFPGSPAHGILQEEEKSGYLPGDSISYRCGAGFVLQGSENRQCTENGTWTNTVPVCRQNIGLRQQTLQSATLWGYNPELAVDNNADTCSFTPKTADQRWWQVALGEQTVVESVAVSITPGSFQHFTVFIIELVEGNQALYKPCSSFQGEYKQIRSVFLCNDGLGLSGQFVYVRDDRVEQEYFGLCEVEVFDYQNKTSPDCGSPEIPVGSLVTKNNTSIIYRCQDGYVLMGSEKLECGPKGQWLGKAPACTEVECEDPMSPKNGYIEVSNFRGRYQYGSIATYKCNPGFILWGNASRLCNDRGNWEGTPPLCHPITCGKPPQVENGVYNLDNGTTTWNSLASYRCKPTFINLYLVDNVSSAVVTALCTLDGTWTTPPIQCQFDPMSIADTFKKGQSLADWALDEDGQLNLRSIILIGVLSFVTVVSMIIIIIILTHKRSQVQVSSRKTSQSSSDNLIPGHNNKLNGDVPQGPDPDVLIYGDLNPPNPETGLYVNPMDTVHIRTSSQDLYGSGSLYSQSKLSTFNRHPPAVPVRDISLCRQSPMSERSCGDGGSDRDCVYSSSSGKPELHQVGEVDESQLDDEYTPYQSIGYEGAYSTIRKPDGEAEEDPYSSVEMKQDEECKYETLGKDNNPTYELVRKFKDGDRSISSETSSTSQATVLLGNEGEGVDENMDDVQALYARVDMAKKQKTRGSEGSGSPWSPGQGSGSPDAETSYISPTGGQLTIGQTTGPVNDDTGFSNGDVRMAPNSDPYTQSRPSPNLSAGYRTLEARRDPTTPLPARKSSTLSHNRSQMTPPSRRASIPVPPPSHPGNTTSPSALARPNDDHSTAHCNGFRVSPLELNATIAGLGQQQMNGGGAPDYEPLNFSTTGASQMAHFDQMNGGHNQQPVLSSFSGKRMPIPEESSASYQTCLTSPQKLALAELPGLKPSTVQRLVSDLSKTPRSRQNWEMNDI